jgi:hypothetical protein
MSFHAANSAAQPNSSLKAPRVASASSRTRNEVCREPSFYGTIAGRSGATVEANIRRRDREGDLGASGSLPSRIPSSTRVHASGLSCALRLGVALLRLTPPFGLRFPASPDPP